MVIAPDLAWPHVHGVPRKNEDITPPHLLAEMRPERMGYRLMLLREALGFRPSEIADFLGIERTYWSRFEGGKRPLSEPVAALLVDRFGVTLDFLILGRWERLPFELAEKMRDVERRKDTHEPASA